MAAVSWRTAWASVVGTSHARTGAPCQDAGCCEVVVCRDGREILLAAVSDGAGSAPRSDEGSKLAVRLFMEEFRTVAAADPGLERVDQALALAWMDGLRDAISALAHGAGCPPEAFACTFLAALAGPERTACFQVGDGAIVLDDGEGGHLWTFWPQHGEFANTTNFVTQDGYERVLEFTVVERPAREVALFTDGIERLVLDMQARTVHSPALAPIFGWLAGTEPGFDGRPAPALEAFLGSGRVNERTDDDKTMVMAVRPGAGVPTDAES